MYAYINRKQKVTSSTPVPAINTGWAFMSFHKSQRGALLVHHPIPHMLACLLAGKSKTMQMPQLRFRSWAGFQHVYLNSSFDQLHGYLFSSIPPVSNHKPFRRQDLGIYKKQFTTSKQNLFEPGIFVIVDEWIQLWRPSDNGTTLHKAS
jgi:hypothetical protein